MSGLPPDALAAYDQRAAGVSAVLTRLVSSYKEARAISDDTVAQICLSSMLTRMMAENEHGGPTAVADMLAVAITRLASS